MELIGAGFVALGGLLLAAMWLSSSGRATVSRRDDEIAVRRDVDIAVRRDVDIAVRRDPLYTRDRVGTLDAEPRRTL